MRILGVEFAGTVECVGQAVTKFRAGDEVFGATGFTFGAHAEYVRLPEHGLLATKPHNMTFDEAAAVLFGGCTALDFLRRQLAKHFGAHVTGVCSGANVLLVKSLGADEVVDYTRDDFSSAGATYDIILDTVGASGFSRSLRSIRPGGRYVRVGGSSRMADIVGGLIRGVWVSLVGPAKVITGVTRATLDDLAFLTRLIEDGKLRTVIEKRYPLQQIADAHRHAEGGHKRGHVVITIA